MKQLTFAGASFTAKKRQTRREKFLFEMEQVVPWAALLELIRPHYPQSGRRGRQPMPLEAMLRIYFLQQWYALSDPAMEDALYEVESMRRFVGLELLDDALPDESTILKFRHLLEAHALTGEMLRVVNDELERRGALLKGGTMVDATIIHAPGSTKNQDKQRDPEMRSTRKGNQWYFGMKAHIGVDADSGLVVAQCHVLPHHDKLAKDEFKRNEGPAGWTAQQGFYVYRNERLLVAGGWLGLGNSKAWNREEAHRLARIQLDIPNTADADWKIDVRKSTARPPVALRPWLTRLAEDTRERARRVFAYRGAPMPTQRNTPIEQAWRVDRVKDGIRYRIESKHPAVAAVLESAGDLAPLIKAMLTVIEESVPVQRIWLDTAENKDTPKTGFSGEPPEAVATVLNTLFADMIGRRGMTVEAARRSLLSTEPFQSYPALIAGLGGPGQA